MQMLLCGALPQGPGAQMEEQDSDEAPEAQPASQPVAAAAVSKGAGKRARKKGKKASKSTARAAAKDAQQVPAEEDDIDAQLRALGLVSVGVCPAEDRRCAVAAKSLAASPSSRPAQRTSMLRDQKRARTGLASAAAAKSHITRSPLWRCEEAFCGCLRW